jgi:hypothetical protein
MPFKQLLPGLFARSWPHPLKRIHPWCAIAACVCRFPGDSIPVIRGSALCALNGDRPEIGKNAVRGRNTAAAAATLPLHLAVLALQCAKCNAMQCSAAKLSVPGSP